MKNKKIISYLSLCAAIIYSSWILGYLLTPNIALSGPASDLAVTTSPYHLMYFMGDLIVTVLIMMCAILLFRSAKNNNTLLVAIFYGLAGLLMLGATLNPLSCIAIEHRCVDATYLRHMMFGISSSLLLATAAVHQIIRRKNWWTSFDFWLIVTSGVLGLGGTLLPSGDASVVGAIAQRIALLISAYFIWRIPQQATNRADY